MKKVWKIFGILALVCLVLGVALTAAGFFAGSSPVTIETHLPGASAGGCSAPWAARCRHGTP